MPEGQNVPLGEALGTLMSVIGCFVLQPVVHCQAETERSDPKVLRVIWRILDT